MKFPYEADDKSEERAKFALNCRALRLHIAANPFKTVRELRKEFNFQVDECLNKLHDMGLIDCRTRKTKLGMAEQWFVVAK